MGAARPDPYDAAMSLRRVLLAVLASWLAPCMAAPGHYIVLQEDAQGRVQVASHALVEMGAPPQLSPTGDWEGHGAPGRRRLAVRALAGSAKVFETDLEAVSERRYEFARPGGGIDGRHVPQA